MSLPGPDLAEALLRAQSESRVIDVVPAARPGSLAEGYNIQAETAARAGRRQIGWKIGSTSPAAQRRRGIEHPVYGRLFEDFCFTNPARLGRADFIDPHIEAEFGFRFGHDLSLAGAPHDRDSVLGAISALVPAIEIADGRCVDWRDCDGAMAVADNVGHGAVILGDAVEGWVPQSLADEIVIVTMDGVELARGSGSAVLGDPVEALIWLANALPRDGHSLRAGDIVITGTCTGLLAVGTGQRGTARFPGFGEVIADFNNSGGGQGSKPAKIESRD